MDSYCDINVVTGALKLYFREMPDPIFPFHFFDMLMAIAGTLTLYVGYSIYFYRS